MGNYCGCNIFSKKVGMSPPVPTDNPIYLTNMPIPKQQNLFTIDVTSVLIGGIAATILIYALWKWR